MVSRTFTAGLLTAMTAAVIGTGVVLAHGGDIEEMPPGYGMDYHMESGDTMGHGSGHGLMHGDPMGPDITGGHFMGPGMMGGYGRGPGMMNPYRVDDGMTGGRMHVGVGLDREQRKQMARIDAELRKEMWALRGEIIDAQSRLSMLFYEEPMDAKKIGAVYAQIFDVRRQMIEAAINAQNRRRAVLTDEQRNQLRNHDYEHDRRGGRDESEEKSHGHGRMGG